MHNFRNFFIIIVIVILYNHFIWAVTSNIPAHALQDRFVIMHDDHTHFQLLFKTIETLTVGTILRDKQLHKANKHTPCYTISFQVLLR